MPSTIVSSDWFAAYATFIRGVIFGVITLLILEGLLIYRFSQSFFTPHERDISSPSQSLTPPNPKDKELLTPTKVHGSDSVSTSEDWKVILEKRIAEENWPVSVITYLKKALTPISLPWTTSHRKSSMSSETSVREDKNMDFTQLTESTDTEHCYWLNILIHRYFLELRKSPIIKARIKKTLLTQMAKKFDKSSLVVSFICF